MSGGERDRSDDRPAFADYRARLDAVGFRPSRRLGQNFLLDPSLHRAIVEAAEVGPRSVVLEIGVGLGFLTRELLASGARVVAVEIDERLVRLVRDEAASWAGVERLQLVGGDALGAGGRLAPSVRDALAGVQAYTVVANLPYAVSGPLLAALATEPVAPATIVALVQLELAERIAAGGAGHDDDAVRGGLAVLLQRFYDARIVRRVGREVFRPRPKVDSAVLRLRAREPGPAWPSAEHRRRFAAWLRALFSGRRKTLRNAVRGACRQLGLPAGSEGRALPGAERRAEQLDAGAHWQLFERFVPAPETEPDDDRTEGG